MSNSEHEVLILVDNFEKYVRSNVSAFWNSCTLCFSQDFTYPNSSPTHKQVHNLSFLLLLSGRTTKDLEGHLPRPRQREVHSLILCCRCNNFLRLRIFQIEIASPTFHRSLGWASDQILDLPQCTSTRADSICYHHTLQHRCIDQAQADTRDNVLGSLM